MIDDPEVVEAADGNEEFKQWRLLRRSHGLYFYEEMTLTDEVYLLEEDGSERVTVAEAYWMATHVSGLYEMSEAARADAVATLPWLRTALANSTTNDRFPPVAAGRQE